MNPFFLQITDFTKDEIVHFLEKTDFKRIKILLIIQF